SLEIFGSAINILTLCCISFAVALFCMPVNLPVEAGTMNYASVALAGIATISWHIIRGRKGFSGP
ncbi:hypothetical protein K432DRAFT_264138, partial [Lepidopterella palustris CBS 459.81]